MYFYYTCFIACNNLCIFIYITGTNSLRLVVVVDEISCHSEGYPADQ